MLRLLCLVCLCTSAGPVMAQQPTRQSLQAQMAEALKALTQQVAELEKRLADAIAAKEDPDTITSLQEQLALLKRQVGMLESQGRNVSRMPARALEAAASRETGKAGVPERDATRIAKVPDGTLSESALAAFVSTIHAEVERLLPGDRTEAAEIYTGLRAENRSSDFMANAASSLWLAGHPELAMLLLGKVAATEPSNVNNLNNYAAFLTMAGGEHAALPILQSLDARFPDNSTILNNIGQAWYGLGDLNRAESVLGQALAAYPRHAQANMTMSRIQEAQGRTAEAIESVKRAIQEHYTGDKEQRVTDLGGSVSFEEIPFPYPRPRGPWPPLGVEKFAQAVPPYPYTAEDPDGSAEGRWKEFREMLEAVKNRLAAESQALSPRVSALQQRLAANPRLLLPYNNPVHNTALRKRAKLFEWGIDRQARLNARFFDMASRVNVWRADLEAVHRNPNSSCAAQAQAARTFMRQANAAYRDHNAATIDFYQQFTAAVVPLHVYAANDPTELAVLLLGLKDQWLTMLNGLRYEQVPVCGDFSAPEPRSGGSLLDFDEVNCDYRETIFIPPFTTIKIECNKMSTVFDVDTKLGAKVKAGWEENLNSGKLTRGTLEFAYGTSVGASSAGPTGAELKLEGGVGVELTPDGIHEAYIKAGASGEVTAVGEGTGMDGGVEVKSSWNAGEKGGESYIATQASGKGGLKSISW